ncbi:lipid A-modifier LpxR family protein [Maritimibacter fusiformis]|uniref:Lipid A deacylase LpxR family protein n=1 Tax=Maritimibacter fusiformis TaxID=2603819 RepID=A0A5D0RLD7_9RHOB|nr:lipid A deacylase LpxR family protein [Maritimibacter fusiformis]
MRTPFLALILLLSFQTLPARAGETVSLGFGRLFTNDALGDGQDRWRSGAYQMSWMRGPEGLTGLPGRAGELIEYRFSTRILAPANGVTPAPGDRRYAGVSALGVYTHFTDRGFDFSLGAELVAVGPMTGVGAFHDWSHDMMGMTRPSAAVLNGQFPNAFHPTLAGEIAWPARITENVTFRPFVQGRLGDETYIRIGGDILIGAGFDRGVLARDETTGITYQTFDSARLPGWGFLVGADSALVGRSVYLPASAGFDLTPLRHRVRAGVQYQGEHFGIFYGATWLGREFSAQPESQVVGSLQIRLDF